MNSEKQLYVALRNIMATYVSICEDAGGRDIESTPEYKDAMAALQAYEMENFGPMPEWAVGHNVDNKLVPGLQLFTLNGRAHGNAHIIAATTKEFVSEANKQNPFGEVEVFEVITDAGSIISDLRESEVLEGWEPGNFISKPAEIVKRFHRRESL